MTNIEDNAPVSSRASGGRAPIVADVAKDIQPRHKKRPIRPPSIVSNIAEALAIRAVISSVYVRDHLNRWYYPYYTTITSPTDLQHGDEHGNEPYKPLSAAGDLFHYFIDPSYASKRGIRLGPSDRVLLMRFPTVSSARSRPAAQLNGAVHSYSGFVVLDHHARELHRKALEGPLPQSSIEGSEVIAQALAEEVAATHGDRFGWVFASGYVANMVAMTAISSDKTIWLLDSACHNSMFVAARASKARRVVRFRHGDYDHLEERLKALSWTADDGSRSSVIVGIEGLYSMEGTFPDLRRVQSLKKEHGFTLFCDECHSILTVGLSGGGVVEYLQSKQDEHATAPAIPSLDPGLIDIRTGGLSKSAGSIGGYATTSNNGLSFMIRSHLFEMARRGELHEPCPLSGMVQGLYNFRRRAILPARLARLWDMSNFVRDQLEAAGYVVFGDRDSPILGVHVGRPTVVVRLIDAASEAGLALVGILPPAVSTARMRLCLNAMLTDGDVDDLLDKLINLGAQLGVVPTRARDRRPPRYSYCAHGHGDVNPTDDEEICRQAGESVAALLDRAATQYTTRQTGELMDKRLVREVKATALASLDQYGLGTGSARWLVGNYDAHVKLEATLQQAFGGRMEAVLFGETRLGALSLAHALCRPLNGVADHVVLLHKACSEALLEGCNSAARSPRVRLGDYSSSVDVVSQVMSSRKGMAFTILLEGTSPLLTGDGQDKARAFMALIRLLGSVTQRSAHSPSITVVVYDLEAIDFRGGDHGLGIAGGLGLPSLSRETRVHIIIYGSFFRAFQLPGAFMVGTNIAMMDEIRWTAPGYCE